MAGVQYAGIASIVYGNQYGISHGGIYHETRGNSIGLGIASVYSLTHGNSVGVQLSGVFAQSEQVTGVQAAPFTKAEQVTGAQVGLINQAGTVYGTQIGLVNIAEDVYGLPIGLINYVQNGINDVSVWFSGDSLVTAGFRNGTRHIYSIFYLGMETDEDWTELNDLVAGAGLGIRVYLPGPFFVDSDLSITRAAVGTNADERISSMVTPGDAAVFPTARIVAGISFGRFGLYAGAALYGETDHSPFTVDRYFHRSDPSHIATPWGPIGIHPQFITGFTF